LNLKPYCINVHGLSTLALGVTLKRRLGCRLIYDTHELESRALAVRGIRRIYSEPLERALIRHCDAVVCVSDGIADWYTAHYGITRPLVVRNVPDRRWNSPSRPVENLRLRCNVPSKALLFLYQGGLAAGRQVERFIEVFKQLPPDRQIVFMGSGELEGAVQRASATYTNIHYHPPVPAHEVLSYTAQADVGLVGVENRCLSYYFSLPNKLFECLVAGVPVVVPDFPEMQRVVDKYRCGWIWSGGTDALTALLKRLSGEDVGSKHQRALGAGKDLSWENEEHGLLKLYLRLFNHGAPVIEHRQAHGVPERNQSRAGG
jgi:glycosyltransferase involved in cell wall biosynthesis